ncbi:hypothetical protein TorRG33x02_326730 [Trema orientale]|uniref:Transmembrane protein n=1 Tax=Trema orientale TaxID=63057 RepID=A0A2P5BBT4_TREOI|nr:hypothetical protein TorRG33x02_326730 [Trema orientale]
MQLLDVFLALIIMVLAETGQNILDFLPLDIQNKEQKMTSDKLRNGMRPRMDSGKRKKEEEKLARTT